MTKIFKWGLIGPGRIAEQFANALPVINDSELYAVASRNKQRATQFAERHNVTEVFDDYAELITHSNIDAIYIATPHRFHYEQIKQCLNAGKPVLCEKPLTVNATQAKELIDLAKQKNVFLMEAVWSRFLPIYQQVQDWLNNKRIGEVISLQSSFGFKVAKNVDDRLYNHDLAGGSLLDMGVYCINLSQWVFNADSSIISATAQLSNTRVDEHTAVNLSYGDDRHAQFICSFLAQHNNDFYIYGTKGKIRIHDMFWCTESASLILADTTETVTKTFRANGFEYEIEEAMTCIRNHQTQSETMPLNQTYQNMRLMDEIRSQIGLRYDFE